MFGTMVVAGATSDHIKVLIPDTFSSPILNANSPVVLQHVVGLSLGTAADLSSSLPADHLDQLLCRNSVLPTLKKKQNSYWAEIHPILEQWRGVNGSTCPVCKGFVKINMSRHLRLSHTTYQCFWRCPVPSCPAWFASAFLGKDHLEEIHGFSEGHGWSFHEFCVGLAWSGTVAGLSLVREARRARHYGWTSRWRVSPVRSCIMITSLRMGRSLVI